MSKYQKAIGRSSRATVTTYTGIFDEIRDLFSKKTGASKSLFSFNSKGACPICKGLGEIKMDMAFMDPVTVICESCEGKRYNQESLSYHFNQKNIVDILAMTVEEALLFFSENHVIKDKLKNLLDVGLGYLSLGQTLSTLSGGELQRIKLATQLDKTGTIYVLDEPTTGLHKSDIKRLVAIFDRLVNSGNTVIIIEHNTDMMKLSDWIIDIGPEAGRHGGELIYSGIPKEILKCEASITANYLK
ncbi:ATP-binding cassette domain-containing protein [Vagococcus carniphilus]|uniref:ATP-binding cassette domain-containing protein n=1 Tax=Vagococcus carniphilus TaxID=218144 RepID=UPI003B58D74A